MITLNAVALDLIPYTLITLFHTRDYPIFAILTSGIFLVLLVIDYCEIWDKGGKSIINEFEEKDQPPQSSIIDRRVDTRVVIHKDLKDDHPDQDNRELDHEETLRRIEQNLAIQSFCTNDLEELRKHSKAQLLLMSNFLFLLKMSVM